MDLPAPGGAGRERVNEARPSSSRRRGSRRAAPRSGDIAREGLIAPPGTTAAAHDGTGRVQLSFTVEGGQDRDVRVPPGVTVFDSASWNGIAIDSTCGGHGTCHKCKVQVDTPLAGLAP